MRETPYLLNNTDTVGALPSIGFAPCRGLLETVRQHDFSFILRCVQLVLGKVLCPRRSASQSIALFRFASWKLASRRSTLPKSASYSCASWKLAPLRSTCLNSVWFNCAF